MLAAATFGALACWRLSAMIPLAVWGAILAGSVLVERWRYRPLADDPPGGDWQATQELFVDPESGRLVTVFFNPATGERRYVRVVTHVLGTFCYLCLRSGQQTLCWREPDSNPRFPVGTEASGANFRSAGTGSASGDKSRGMRLPIVR
jgi:hypothetical protein